MSFSSNNYKNYYNAKSLITSTVVDNSGNVYSCGAFDGIYDFDPGPGQYIVESGNVFTGIDFFAKYNQAGNLVFVNHLPINISSIALDSNNNIYITGTFDQNADFDPSDSFFTIPISTKRGYFIAKYNNEGKFIYAKGGDIDGYSFEAAIKFDQEGNILFSGLFSGNVDFNLNSGKTMLQPLGDDLFFAKYKSDGTLLFVKSVGGYGSVCLSRGVEFDSENNILFGGIIQGAAADFDPGTGKYFLNINNDYSQGFIAKYSPAGDFIFAFDFPQLSKGPYEIAVTALGVDHADNIYAGGLMSGRFDFDPGQDTIASYGKIDNFIVSYSKYGNLRSIKKLEKLIDGGSIPNSINSMDFDKKNNLYVAGSFYSTQININVGGGAVILENESYSGGTTHNTSGEMYVAVYDSSNNYISSYNFNNDSAAHPNSIANIIVQDNRIVLAGNARSKIDFDFGNAVNYFEPTSLYNNLFIAQYAVVPAAVVNKNYEFPGTQVKQKLPLYVLPNPAIGYITIMGDVGNIQEIFIADESGAIVLQQKFSGSTIQLNSLPGGIYFLKVLHRDKSTQTIKFIKG